MAHRDAPKKQKKQFFPCGVFDKESTQAQIKIIISHHVKLRASKTKQFTDTWLIIILFCVCVLSLSNSLQRLQGQKLFFFDALVLVRQCALRRFNVWQCVPMRTQPRQGVSMWPRCTKTHPGAKKDPLPGARQKKTILFKRYHIRNVIFSKFCIPPPKSPGKNNATHTHPNKDLSCEKTNLTLNFLIHQLFLILKLLFAFEASIQYHLFYW